MEAITGPAAVDLLRERDRELQALEVAAKAPAERIPAMLNVAAAKAKSGATSAVTTEVNVDSLAERAVALGGASVLAATVEVADAKALLDVVDRLRGKLPEAAIVLGTAVDGRVHLVASVAPALVERGVKAGSVVKSAAEVVGGGGGGRDTMAQAGGSRPDKLTKAIEAAQTAIGQTLEG
jgi:alanyl-tRNA synthetase